MEGDLKGGAGWVWGQGGVARGEGVGGGGEVPVGCVPVLGGVGGCGGVFVGGWVVFWGEGEGEGWVRVCVSVGC